MLERSRAYLSEMNCLPGDKRIQIISLVLEGVGMREISKSVDVSINTVKKLLFDVGKSCVEYHDRKIIHMTPKVIELRAINDLHASMVNGSTEEKGLQPHNCVWFAVDIDSKFIISYLIGDFSLNCRDTLLVETSKRCLKSPRFEITFQNSAIQLTSKPNTTSEPKSDKQYHNHVLLKAMNHSDKRVENFSFAIGLHLMFNNFISIQRPFNITSATKLGLTDKAWVLEDIVNIHKRS